MLVKHINDKGFIHFIQMGGLTPRSAESQRVIIHGRKPVPRGVVVPKPAEKDGKAAALDDLLMSTPAFRKGAASTVDMGDIVTFDSDVSLLNGKMWVGRNFDDRIGTYCLLEAMRQVRETRVDVYAVSWCRRKSACAGCAGRLRD